MTKHTAQDSKTNAKAGSPSSKARSESYCVVAYGGMQFVGVIAGMGSNRGTWDSSHSRRTAQRHARNLRRERPDQSFRVESVT